MSKNKAQLLRPISENPIAVSNEPNEAYLNWIRKKHRFQSPEFVNRLVETCAAQFAVHPQLTVERQAQIYKSVRERLQQKHDGQLRKHSKIQCRS
jgi:hypothetical protein